MQPRLDELGYKYMSLNITNWKMEGKRPQFGEYGNFRNDVKRPGYVNEFDPSKEYVALWSKDHVYVDVDWKDDFEPSAEQREKYEMLVDSFPSYPSMTKQRWGRHILIPRANFKGLPPGEPKLHALCSGDNQVEVLGDKPAIIRSSLFQSHNLHISQMSPPLLKFEDFGGEAQPTPILRKISPRTPVATTEKVDADLRAYLAMLSHERCHNRQYWFPITVVCKLVGDKTAWDDWSKKSSKYNYAENNSTWGSIHDSSFTMGTVKKWAREDNEDGYCQYTYSYAKAKEQVEKKGFAWLDSVNKLVCNGVEISQLDMRAAVMPIQFWSVDAKGRGKMKGVYEAWLADPERKTWARRDFIPYNPLEGDPSPDNVYNTAPPFAFDYVPDATEEDLAELKQIIEANCMCETTAQYVLSWIADIFQKPRNKPGTSVIFKGHRQGTGKGSLFILLSKILGHTYVHSTNDLEQFFGQYNTGLNNKLLIGMEEMEGKNGVKYKEAYKTLVTQPTVEINEKYKSQVIQQCHTRTIVNSNNFEPVQIDRRTVFAQTDPLKTLPTEFWENFYGNILTSQEKLNRIGSALLNLDISSINLNKPPKMNSDDESSKLVRPFHVLVRLLLDGRWKFPEKDGCICVPVNEFKHKYREVYAQVTGKSGQGNKVLLEMKKWLKEYGGLTAKCKLHVGGIQRDRYHIDKARVEQCLRINSRYPSNELLEEYGLLQIREYDE